MGKFERKFGRYAIKNLSMILIICYAIGYLIYLIYPEFLNNLTLNPYLIVHGQVWRIISWILVPPTLGFDFFTLIMLFFYFSIGRTLERTWGDYLFNVYVLSGILFTIVASFGVYIFTVLVPPVSNEYYMLGGMNLFMQYVSLMYSTYYINMSIFLAFALTFPDSMVLLMFIFPVKMKWLGYIDGAYMIYLFIVSNVYTKVAIAAALLNFIIFFAITRRRRFGSPRQRMQRAARSREFRNTVRREAPQKGVSKHKCAICGRTEITNPELQFRFCSKCNGNYEYCNEHLFNHKHVE
ncbi:hypothetical protein SAMN02910339_00016 [Lachnospiraceae bacterium YSD2013]|nr:hypothetical protein SAMN02910339_00016 [Lachnospiraceae bacterium YSD2013]